MWKKCACLLLSILAVSCVYPEAHRKTAKLELMTSSERYEKLAPQDSSLKISLWDQKVWLLDKDKQVALVTDISTGIDGRETSAGRYQVLERIKNKRSNLYGKLVSKATGEVEVERSWEYEGPIPKHLEFRGTEMLYWMRLTWDGVGMHIGKFEQRKRSSFGCVRVYEKAQPLIYAKTRLGTPVEIVERSLMVEMAARHAGY